MARKRFLILGLILGIAVSIFIIRSLPARADQQPEEQSILSISIPEKTTFGELTRWLGFPAGATMEIVEAAKGKYNLATIVSGRPMALVYDSFTGDLEGLTYQIDSEEKLDINLTEEGIWEVDRYFIPYETREGEAEGVIESSLYGAVIDSGKDERLALAIAEMFAWQVDFVADTRVGDSFKVIYEERYLDGEYVMPGRILAAEYINDGAEFKGFYFEGEKTKAAHYDEDGNSLQKEFLKAPLQYKYISSGYSYSRVNPITRRVSAHRGIDYAAPRGTPAVSVGSGTVIQAGWNGPYGISVMIRHNNTYTTRYGHFSSLAKGIRVGAKVKQGQFVGFVGSTGQSTGPHLHYEMHKFGAHVNPFRVEIPPGDPIHEDERDEFQSVLDQYLERL